MAEMAKFGPRNFGLIPSKVDVLNLDGSVATTYTTIAGTTQGPATFDGAGAVTFFALNGTYQVVLTVPGSLDTQKFTVTLDNATGVSALTATGSPMTITASSARELIYVSGGAGIAITRNGVNLGITSGQVGLHSGESVVIAYTTAPTIVRDRK